jgi:ATP-dependent protease HslVU (ClpYQ) peptidase subunit
MSVVAVRKESSKITIGADSIRISGWGTQEKDKLAKLFRVSKDLVVGTVGDAAIHSLFREYLKNHLPKSNTEYGWTNLIGEFSNYLNDLKNAPKLENSAFIVVDKQKVFYIASYFVREINDYYAIGAGMDYALSALYLGSTVKKAIEAACHLSIFCEKPAYVIEIKK